MDDLFEAGELITAEFSPCRAYRYILRRRWDSRPPENPASITREDSN